MSTIDCNSKMNMNKKMNKAIIYCRLSRKPDASRGIMSLDSQEFAVKEFMRSIGITGIFAILKNIGSAFSKPQLELKNLLKSCKNKTLIVYEPNRLSRNLQNFKEIYKICEKNKHNIGIVTMNTIFDIRVKSNYKVLFDLIENAEKESRDMGKRISRTYRYKKSREVKWGFMRNEKDDIVINPIEQKITKLVRLLHSRDSSVLEIRNLILKLGETEGKEPFEIIEYGGGETKDIVDKLPYGMSIKNIEKTLNYYEVKYRKSRWNADKIETVLGTKSSKTVIEDDIDDLISDMSLKTREVELDLESNKESQATSSTQELDSWVCIWYNPSVGLPPGVVLPPGMKLPTISCELYIPK